MSLKHFRTIGGWVLRLGLALGSCVSWANTQNFESLFVATQPSATPQGRALLQRFLIDTFRDPNLPNYGINIERIGQAVRNQEPGGLFVLAHAESFWQRQFGGQFLACEVVDQESVQLSARFGQMVGVLGGLAMMGNRAERLIPTSLRLGAISVLPALASQAAQWRRSVELKDPRCARRIPLAPSEILGLEFLAMSQQNPMNGRMGQRLEREWLDEELKQIQIEGAAQGLLLLALSRSQSALRASRAAAQGFSAGGGLVGLISVSALWTLSDTLIGQTLSSLHESELRSRLVAMRNQIANHPNPATLHEFTDAAKRLGLWYLRDALAEERYRKQRATEFLRQCAHRELGLDSLSIGFQSMRRSFVNHLRDPHSQGSSQSCHAKFELRSLKERVLRAENATSELRRLRTQLQSSSVRRWADQILVALHRGEMNSAQLMEELSRQNEPSSPSQFDGGLCRHGVEVLKQSEDFLETLPGTEIEALELRSLRLALENLYWDTEDIRVECPAS